MSLELSNQGLAIMVDEEELWSADDEDLKEVKKQKMKGKRNAFLSGSWTAWLQFTCFGVKKNRPKNLLNTMADKLPYMYNLSSGHYEGMVYLIVF